MPARFAPRRLIWLLLGTSLVSCAPQAATPTPLLAGRTESAPPVHNEAAVPTPQPFRFDLPLPGAPPISGWRPPLYPIPWAISPYDHFYFARPIAADQVNWPLAIYRYGGIFFAPNIVHTGVDIPAPEGTPVRAAGPGTVIWADWGLFTESPGNHDDPYGQAVVIRHDFGYKGQQLYTVYAHMSQILAVVGQHVETGDLLGRVGATGATTGPHLHFEVRLPINSFHHTYNPELWIAPPEGWGVLVARLANARDDTLQQLEVSVTKLESEETYLVRTYGPGPINRDPVFRENLVLGDLPAGLYKITFHYRGRDQQEWVSIYPGQITYFTFRGALGFQIGLPPAPALDFLPPVAEP